MAGRYSNSIATASRPYFISFTDNCKRLFFSIIGAESNGNHRMKQARRKGEKTIMGYRIGPEDHMRFITTKKAYLTYIEYWNEKTEQEKF
jgi:hypothetical protein